MYAKNSLRMAAAAIAVNLGTPWSTSFAEDISVWAKRLTPEVVAIKTSQQSGSGFWLDDQGHVATCMHIVKPDENGLIATDISVESPTGDNVGLPTGSRVFQNMMAYRAKVVAEDEPMDIAVLLVTPSPFKTPSILPPQLGGHDFAPRYEAASLDLKVPDKGESLIFAGFPLGQPALEFQPATMGSLTVLDGGFRIQFSGFVNHGNSGGPLFNSAGKVVGLVCSLKYDPEDKQRSGLNQAVPAAFVDKLWKNVR